MPARSSSSVRVFYPKADRADVVRTLRERIGRLRDVLPVSRLVLFGSYARGTRTVASDIDVLVVYRGQPRADAYAVARRVLDIRGLEPHVYAEGEYAAVAPTVDRMIRGGIEIPCQAPTDEGGGDSATS
jgi:predicted nucleotidyltransferase